MNLASFAFARKLPLTLTLALAASVAFLAGCGGTVTGTGGSGGSGASGGSGGSTTGTAGSGGTGGQSADCPAQEPTSGDACSVDPSLKCSYGDNCCPDQWSCTAGQWQQWDVDCGAPAGCPATAPEAGAECAASICAQWSPCGYACDGTNALLATCTDGKWELLETPCADPIPCGDVTCEAGQVCLENGGGVGLFYSCQEDPCAGQALSCECAASLCGGSPDECGISGPSQVSCICPDCP